MPEKIRGKIVAGSEKAVLLETEVKGKTEEVWIPKSQIAWEKNWTVEIVLKDFIANAKGFISDEEFAKREAENKKQQEQPEQPNLPF
jgi:hypothetical protein